MQLLLQDETMWNKEQMTEEEFGEFKKVVIAAKDKEEWVNEPLTEFGGKTLIFAAIIHHQQKCLEFLLDEAGADPNHYVQLESYSKIPISPLILATQRKNHEAMKALIQKGADVNSKTEHENTALHYATTYGTAIILLNEEADINVKNKSGVTAITQCPADALESFLDKKCIDHTALKEIKEENFELMFDHG